MEATIWVVFPRARVTCPTYGPPIDAVPWLDRSQGMTTRFAVAIARLAMRLPILRVAGWFGVDWEDLRVFAELLGPARCAQIDAIAVDMNLAYTAGIAAQCPQAAIVYDLFHVVVKYRRQVIDRGRAALLAALAPPRPGQPAEFPVTFAEQLTVRPDGILLHCRCSTHRHP